MLNLSKKEGKVEVSCLVFINLAVKTGRTICFILVFLLLREAVIF
jgi:hypothetical protein